MVQKRAVFYIALVFAAIFVQSCTLGVLQYQRQYLGDPIMQPDADPLDQKLENHMLPNREGSSGGSGAAGGGCGC